MKKITTLLLLVFTFTLSAQTYMPDDNFEAWCESLGYGDGIANNDTINSVIAVGITQLDLDNLGIIDLTGLDAFVSATVINLANNPGLSVIDISFFQNQLTFFTATGCSPNLYCITVADTAYAASQSGYSIDSQASYSTDCNTAFGCMDPLACNYSITASIDTLVGGSCSYNVDTIFPAVDVCDVFVWPFNGMPYTISGTYSDTIPTVSGCDSIGEITVIIRNTAHSYDTTNTLICNSTIWNNLLIDFSGDYDYTFLNGAANGCDSVAHLHAIIEDTSSGSSSVTACDSYTWDGTVYTSSTTDSKTYTNVAGCDSVHTLNLTIDNSHTFTDVQVHCNSYTWINGVTYFTSNNTDSVAYQTVVGGCDSIIFLDLTINDSTFITTTETSCDLYNWSVNGAIYTTSGTHTHISTDLNNCVQVDTLHLTVNYSNGSTDTVVACDSYTWIDGNTYTVSNSTATFTDTNIDNCDSIIALNLTINYSSDTTDVDSTVCSFFIDALGNIYDTTAIYTYILTNGSGCDSVIRLDLTVDFPDSSLTTLAVCDSYTWNGTTYDSTGIYTYPTTTVLGCDSVAVLDLFIGYTETHIDTVYECDNYVWFDANGDTIFTQTNQNVGLSGTVPGNYGLDGVFHDTIVYTNIGGCDSIRILHLTVNSSIISSSQAVDVFACDSWTNPYTGQVITTSGSQTVTTGVSPQGCDSLQWYNIYLTAEKRHDITETACDTFEWIIANDFGGIDTLVYTSSTLDSVVYTGIENVYLNNTGDTVGTTICDSIVYLHLTINNSTSNTDVQTHCDSYTWWGPIGDGNTYNVSGVYNHVTQNASTGCNHTEILDLTIYYSNPSTDIQAHCGSYTWMNGVTYENLTSLTTNETATFMLSTTNGCDSLVTLDLTLFPIYSIALPPVIACDSFHWELSAGGTGVTYFSTGNYTSQFTSVDGCDSLIILDLTIDNSHTYTDVQVACDSFTWIDGNTYTASNNIASFTYPTYVGQCDSTIFLDLTVNYSNTGQSADTACDSYIWDGDTITASGTFLYSKVYTNSVGCDSVHTLELTINNSNAGSSSVTACDHYTWIGSPQDGIADSTYTQSGTYTNVYTNAAGCDSVHTLNLTIDSTVVTHETVTSCYNYVWTPWSYPNNTYTFDTTSTFNAGVNSLTYIVFGNAINTSVCTDTAFLHLTINPLEYGTAAMIACDSYLWEGTVYNTTGVYIDTIAGTYCDSIVTLDLTINSSDVSSESDTICDVYTWFDGNGDTIGTFYNSGTYSHTFTNQAGCDSVHTLDLFVKSSSLAQLNVTACDSLVSGYWDANGWVTETYFVSTSFTYPVPGGNSVGCDSLVEMNITINNSWSGDHFVTACNSYDFAGITYTNDTVVTATLSGVECDSIVTLFLTINTQNSSSIHNVGTHCDSYTWIDGNTYTSSNNTATMIYTAANGCDSILTLNLIINNSVSHTDTHVACDIFIWSCDGGIYTSSNNSATYTYYNGAANGCDSVVTLDLTINTSTSGSSTVVACDYYVWDGTTYFNDTIVSKIYTNAAGCDSSHTLNLTIDNNPGSISNQVACDSYTWIDGNTYYNDTIVDFIIVNSSGCDSTVILDLTINNSTSGTDNQVACGSYTWIDGVTYTNSNNTATWMYPGASVNGCDSVVTLNLVITTQNYSTIDSVGTQCDSYTWIDGNTYTSSNNTATMVYSAVNGCDSIVRLQLVIVSSPSVLVVQNTNMFDVVINGGIAPFTYSWSGPITSTDASIEPLVSGVYCVEVTDAVGCVSNNSCLPFSISAINEIPLSKFEIYPNPASDIVNLEFTTKRPSDYAIQILSVTGLQVYYDKLTNFNGNYKGVIDLSTYSNGTYVIQIVSGNNIVYRKLIKQ